MNRIKKIFLTLCVALGLCAFIVNPISCIVKAEESQEPNTATIVVNKFEHGEYVLSSETVQVGETIEIQINPNIFYYVDCVTLNGANLIESETTSGLYSFVVVEGENIINVVLKVDTETLGAFAEIYREAADKDWDSLFSVETIVTIVKWLLDGGILIAMARYFIKDKKMESKVESSIKENMNSIIPQTTKETVIASIENNMAPLFEKYEKYLINSQEALSTFSKCLALSTENTPESKLAILEALTNLEIGDKTVAQEAKKYVNELVLKAEQKFNETMEALNKIETTNKEVIENTKEVVNVVANNNISNDDGTLI